MKSPWIGLFTILSANYRRNNYRLNLHSDPCLILIYYTFYIGNIKPHVNTNYTVFPEQQLAKPEPVSEERYELEKIIEYYKEPKSSIPQY